MAAADHFDWPVKTRDAILASYKDKNWTLSEHVSRTDTAGQPVTPQMITWGALDYLYSKDAAALAAMLVDLSELHAEAAGRRINQGQYLGEPEATARVLAEQLDAVIDARQLASHLKKLR